MGPELWDRENLGKPWAYLYCGQNQHLPSLLLIGFSWYVPEAGPVLPQNSIIWGGCLDFCFIRCKTHWDHFCLDSCLFLQNRLFYTLSLLVLLHTVIRRLCLSLFYFVFFLILFYFYTLQYCISFAKYRNESTTDIPVFLILNPPPSSLPIPSLWVVPVH